MAEQSTKAQEVNPTQKPTQASNSFLERHGNKLVAGAGMATAGALGKVLTLAVQNGDPSYIPQIVASLGMTLYSLSRVRN